MANAEALLKRHIQALGELQKGPLKEQCREPELFQAQVILYAACIIAEAIRNKQDEAEFTEPSK